MAIGDDRAPPRGRSDSPDEPLLDGRVGLFEMRNRPRRDVPWLIAYLLLLLGALAGGVFAFMHRNTRFEKLVTPESMSDPHLCPIDATSHAARRLLQQGPDAPSPFDFDLFMRAAGMWAGASVGGALLVGLLFVWLVRVSPGALVATALGLQVSVPAAVGILALTRGSVGAGVALLGLAGLTLLVFILWKQQVQLVTALLGLAGRGLSANPGLVPMALGLQLLALGLLETPLLLALIGAAMNGTLAFNPHRADRGAAESPEQCVDAEGDSVSCCVWKTEPWVPAYMTLAGIAMTWTLFLAFQIKLYTVGGTIAQWYFEPVSAAAATDDDMYHGGGGASSSSADAANGGGRRTTARRRRSRTLTALRFAAGPSLGSLCCGSAILTLVSMIRQAMEKARQERDRNLLAACAAACCSLLLSLLEFVTRFATVRAAVTGEAFLTAGRGVVQLLKRNAMDAFGVWWLPPMIIQSCCFLLSASWAAAVSLLSYATTWRHQAHAASPHQASVSAWLTALLALLAAWAVLGFLGSLLLNVIDALFVCFAMDRDLGQVSAPEVHQVMGKLPSVGVLVQQ
ncbi:hypothetical protein Agub_g9390, partial [Astrephomene gubernaculifera]